MAPDPAHRPSVSASCIWSRFRVLALVLLFFLACLSPADAQDAFDRLETHLKRLSEFSDRSTGSNGCEQAAMYIREKFIDLDLQDVGMLRFSLPVVRAQQAFLSLPGSPPLPVDALNANAMTPPATGPQGLTGPVIYVGDGELARFNGKAIKESLVLMDLDSGKNWLHAANLGAKALVYLDRGVRHKSELTDKFELSPLQFPRFLGKADRFEEVLGSLDSSRDVVAEKATLLSRAKWENKNTVNVYGVVKGSDPHLSEQLVIVEAYFDSTARVLGRAPGADEALGMATLLCLAEEMAQAPPKRSVLFLATSGHAQSLQGLREAVWALKARSRDLRRMDKDLKKKVADCKTIIKLSQSASFPASVRQGDHQLLGNALLDAIKTQVDLISRQLISLRLMENPEKYKSQIDQLAKERLQLRGLLWLPDWDQVKPGEARALNDLLPAVQSRFQAILEESRTERKNIKSARAFRALVAAHDEVAASMHLHLSSHGNGVGAFNYGFLYPFRERINRSGTYTQMERALTVAGKQWAGKNPGAPQFQDSLRPSLQKPWQAWFLDRPALGGEVTALAGLLGVTFATTGDGRPRWGTPSDVPQAVNLAYATRQARLVDRMTRSVADEPDLVTGSLNRNGFSTVRGRAKFIRHGELFADQAAPGTIIQAYQGPGVFYTLVNQSGDFIIKGVADKKHSYHKVVIEGYKLNEDTGQAVWAIDKNQTGKNAYRVKMLRKVMETDLVMFACRQTTIFDLLAPRNLHYMTKPTILDGRTDAEPMRFWYSRIDTRESVICSTYLEPGARLKMTLSDSVLTKKFLLTNASQENPLGTGYPVDSFPLVGPTELYVARDMWRLLGPRIENLNKHGINDQRIDQLRRDGLDALEKAETALEKKQYDEFFQEAKTSWALASRVYDHVDKTQRDVLFGVLFYIALFVPFAFCAERLMFAFTDIHKRIVAFLGILFVVIGLIYSVHPAFNLAYSPMVVILAFFIMGLSLIVSSIIFFRFEEEMVSLQRGSAVAPATETSRWKAFSAAFFLGVTNLRRRKVRTALTVVTLVILTFTIMSFTSVKSVQRQAKVRFSDNTPYQGLMFKSFDWKTLPETALSSLDNAFTAKAWTAPRVWLENEERTQQRAVPLVYQDKSATALGMVGLSSSEPKVTGMDRVLESGKWFEEDDRYAVLLSNSLAQTLGFSPREAVGKEIRLWGMPFVVRGVFDEEKYGQFKDLDGEEVTPVTFPSEAASQLTEEEAEAMESGEDVRAFQSRYRHTDPKQTIVIPASTLLALGGNLKGLAVRPENAEDTMEMARHMVDRFALTIFSGEPGGTYLYHASDAISYSGVPNILIPILISILIVLNTMISSVFERKKEIAVYTSVGLAPSHVGFLFVAEALAFAVLSVVIGYLAAQISAELFSNTGLWAGITVNYSSLAGVAAMILVISVVLLSVIYPSRLAASIAIPDVKRAWSLPEPEGNTLAVTLPFLMKYAEQKSMGGFLYSHYASHKDASHGLFSVGRLGFDYMCPLLHEKKPEFGEACTSQACEGQRCLHLKTRVWLAPFDFGIHQWVDIEFIRSKMEPEFLEVRAVLQREAGEANAWLRINKAFLDDMRKQLLVWRSLSPEQKRETEKILDSEQGEPRVDNLEGKPEEEAGK